PQQAQLVVAPQRAEPLLLGRRRAVAAPGRRASGVAARHRRAVEGRVELVLVELEPAAQRLSGATAPRPSFFALDDARRLAEEVRALALTGCDDRQGLERVAGLGACAADTLVALHRRERPVVR